MRRRDPESSLEFLLDTVCNTFGGVLFLAILICVLLKSSSDMTRNLAASGPQSAEVRPLQKRQAVVLGQLSALIRASAEQAKSQQELIKPGTEQSINELNNHERQRDALIAERLKTAQNITKHQLDIDEIKKDLDGLAAQVSRTQQERIGLQKSLEQAVQSKSRVAYLPRLRNTRKREIGLVVRYGRVYVLHNYDRTGLRTGLNMHDFAVVRNGILSIEARPKPYRGAPLQPGGPSPALIETIARFNPNTQYFGIPIWEDSFEQFQYLKNVLVERGFEYRLIPMREGHAVTDRGGTGGQVQ